MDKFTNWLEDELKKRDWQPADLARKANLGSGTVHRILNQERKAGPEVAVAIAEALGESPVKIFRLAGLLPPEPEPAPGERELLHVYRDLSKNEQVIFLNMARGLAGQPPVQTINNERVVYNVQRKPPPALPPDDPHPDLESIMDLVRLLDQVELYAVYDYIRWRLHEQHHRRDSHGQRRGWSEEEMAQVEQALGGLNSADRENLLNWVLDYTSRSQAGGGPPGG